MQLCFTVDWEDWYHGLGLDPSDWKRLERRIKIGHYRLLDLLSKYRIKATFFLLGIVMEEFPNLVAEIKNEGHELACHTYSHPFLANITAEMMRSELQRCKILINDHNCSYRGFRAPYFSIKKSNLWVLDMLKEEGFVYDSSIFPGNTFRSGITGFNEEIAKQPNGLIEFPISNFSLSRFRVGIGGAYFRLTPYTFFRSKLRQLLRTRPSLFYFHPWELDPKQPYITGLKHRAVHTHYYNLSNTARKLERLFEDFEFTTLSAILEKTIITKNKQDFTGQKLML